LIHMAGSLKLQQFTAAQIGQEQERGVLILDTRPAELFASAHISGAMQLGLMGPFASWAAMLIAPTQRLVIVSQDQASAQEAQVRLVRVGLEHIAGFTLADEKQWRHHGIRLAALPIFESKDASRNQQEGRTHQIIDVRSSAEWLKGHLPGAISIPLQELNSEAPPIDFSKPSLVYCREGYRATTAASVLLRRNARDVGIMIDTFECIGRPQTLGVAPGTPSAGLKVSSPVHL
jgi:rhodanese-related sulfurtransferase